MVPPRLEASIEQRSSRGPCLLGYVLGSALDLVDHTIRLAAGGTRSNACLPVFWSVLRHGPCPSGSWWARNPPCRLRFRKLSSSAKDE